MIDFHTHHINKECDELAVYCSTDNFFETPKGHYFCLGHHPWFISDSPKIDKLEAKIKILLEEEYFFGLGEIGLDKVRNIDFKLQQSYLIKQVELAVKYKIKTLILHSVRSFNEIFEILKSTHFSGNILFHDYRAHHQVYHQFAKIWPTYISVGHNAYLDQKRASHLKMIPCESILCESDEAYPKKLEECLAHQSHLFGVTTEDIKKMHLAAFHKLKQN